MMGQVVPKGSSRNHQNHVLDIKMVVLSVVEADGSLPLHSHFELVGSQFWKMQGMAFMQGPAGGPLGLSSLMFSLLG